MRLSELELNIVHSAGIKRQAADTLSRIKSKREDETALDEEVSVLTISQEYFAYASKTEKSELDLIEDRKGHLVLFIPEVCMMKGISDNDKLEIPTLVEFIAAQSNDADCRSTFASVR